MSEQQKYDTQRDDQKSPERLEREADQVRERLGRTVDALSNRLSPGELLDQGLHMVREHGGEFGRNLGEQAKQNPVPLLLTALGLSWMMLSDRRAGTDYSTRSERWDRDADLEHGEANVREKVGGAVRKVSDTVGKVTDTVSGAIDSAKDAVHRTADRAHDITSSVKDEAGAASSSLRRRTQRTRDNVTTLFHDQPLIAGAFGIAIGAALGAMLPSTETEDRLLGEASDEATAQARTMASEQYERVKDAAKDVAGDMGAERFAAGADTEGDQPRPH